jgi:small-conductance mechanosensitive channel
LSVRRRLITWLGRAPPWAARLFALWGGLALAIGAVVTLVLMDGSVVEIGLFSTRLRTYDGIFVFVPNSNLWNYLKNIVFYF